jgi:1-deoxy-D-xylulose-5-phosphate synthase
VSFLDKINSPADLKELSKEHLPALAQEIRDFLIDSVSVTGGHLGPSLGVVELTLALHYLYETPKDKFIWDVGHQAYIHKMLTGRRDQFNTLRQLGGISGFPHITESKHDAMTVGHASTSISAALGMAHARDLTKKDGDIFAIIGDGALTGGLALEALNNLGHSKTKMTIILNDNEMSIAPNVGGLSKYLTKIITDKKYNRLKSTIWDLLDHLPKVGKPLQEVAHNIDDAVKKVITPGKFFEDMGINYIGPVDGHNFEELLAVLKFAKEESNGPLLIHVLTQKGRGYTPAEDNATKFHGVGSFKKDTGEIIKSSGGHPSWSAVFGDTLSEIVEDDRSVVAVTAAMPDGTGLGNFRKKYPEQLIDVGIAEGHAVTFAAGLSLNGIKPVVAIYSTFLQRAYDHIMHDVALESLNVVFAIDRAGVVGNDGPTHHGGFDISFLRTIPNLTILTPSCGNELRTMLKSAIYEIDGPVAIRYPRGNVPDSVSTEKIEVQSEFKPHIIKKGKSILLVSVGNFLEDVKIVCSLLEKEDFNPTILDLRCVKPLDKDSFEKLFSENETVISFEHNTIVGGAGTSLKEISAELVEEKKLTSAPNFLALGYPDSFVTQGNMNELMVEMDLTPEKMSERIIKFIK